MSVNKTEEIIYVQKEVRKMRKVCVTNIQTLQNKKKPWSKNVTKLAQKISKRILISSGKYTEFETI